MSAGRHDSAFHTRRHTAASIRHIGGDLPMKLFLADDLWLIAYDEWNGRLRVDEELLSLGLAGALLSELLLGEAITVVDGEVWPGRQLPVSGLTHMMADRIESEPRRDVATWLRFYAKTAHEDVVGRLVLWRWIRAEAHHGLRRKSVRYKGTSQDVSSAIGWRPLRLSSALGASDLGDPPRIESAADGALVMLCHAIGVTGVVLREAAPRCQPYIDQIHRWMQGRAPALHHVATCVGEIVSTNTSRTHP